MNVGEIPKSIFQARYWSSYNLLKSLDSNYLTCVMKWKLARVKRKAHRQRGRFWKKKKSSIARNTYVVFNINHQQKLIFSRLIFSLKKVPCESGVTHGCYFFSEPCVWINELEKVNFLPGSWFPKFSPALFFTRWFDEETRKHD